MGSLSFVCAWCAKPLLDAEHARKHVLTQCAKAPATEMYLALLPLARWPLTPFQETAGDDTYVVLGGPGTEDAQGRRFGLTVGQVRSARAAIAAAERAGAPHAS